MVTTSARPRERSLTLGGDLLSRIALSLICLSPLAIIPGGLNRFVFGKLALCAAGIAVACGARHKDRLRRPAVWLTAAGALLLFGAALASASPSVALLGRAPRYEGLPVLLVYFGAFVSGARLLGPRRTGATDKTLCHTLAVVAVAVAVLGALEAMGVRPLASNLLRPGSFLGNASDEGALGVLLVGPLTVKAITTKDRLCMVGSVAAAVIVVVSGSRGALLGAVVVAAVVAAVLPSRPVRRLVIGGVAAMALAAIALPATRSRVLDTSALAAGSARGRLLLWKETVRLILHYPLLGVGPGGFVDRIPSWHDLEWQKAVGPAYPPDSPHNWVLQAAGSGGLIFLLVVLAIATLVVVHGWRHARSEWQAMQNPLLAGALAAVCGYAAALLFHFTSPGTTCLAALFSGALLSEDGRDESGYPWATPVTVSASLLLALVFFTASLAEIPLRAGIEAVARGDMSTATRDFSLAGRLRPWDVDIKASAGHAFAAAAANGHPEAVGPAITELVPALRSLPLDEDVQVDLVTADETAGNYAEALRLMESSVEGDRFNPELLLRLGVLQGESGRYAGAATTLKRVIAIEPKSPQPWHDLSVVYSLENEPSMAQAAGRRAAELSVRHVAHSSRRDDS